MKALITFSEIQELVKLAKLPQLNVVDNLTIKVVDTGFDVDCKLKDVF
jgi:hypothetical protein